MFMPIIQRRVNSALLWIAHHEMVALDGAYTGVPLEPCEHTSCRTKERYHAEKWVEGRVRRSRDIFPADEEAQGQRLHRSVK